MSRLTLERILSKCEEDGDCLIWQGKVHQRTGAPAGTEWINGKDYYVGVRRRAYEEYHGVTLGRNGEIATCGHPKCLAKKHLELITRSERVRRMHRTMDAATKLRRSQSLARAQQERMGKFTPEQVAAIRDSEDGPYVTAQRLGVSGVVASRIRRGVSYREYAGNPFAGLLALAANDGKKAA